MAESAVGRVNRSYSTIDGTYFRLTDTTDALPEHGYFWLPLAHPNYRSVFACCLAGQLNNINVQMRCKEEIVPTEIAEIVYVTLDS